MIEEGSIRPYVFGFTLSLLFTLGAYWTAVNELPRLAATVSIAGISLCQAWVFLFFYLGFGRETKPRWNLMVFLFMLLVTFLLVGGSIWIMYHLNYNLILQK